MKSLQEFLKDAPKDERFFEDYDNLYKTHIIENFGSYDNWLFCDELQPIIEEINGITISTPQTKKWSNNLVNVPTYWYYQIKLYERINDSLKGHDNILLKLFSHVKGITKVNILNDYLLEVIYNDTFDENSDEFIRLLNFCNYFISNRYNDNKIQLEARIPQEIDYDCDYVYHVTSTWGWDKIQKNGAIIPKSKSSLANYDIRIYLWLNNANNFEIQSYGRFMLRLYNELIDNNDKHNLHNKINIYKDAILLKIDLRKFNNDHKEKLKLFGDFNNLSKSAVFTMEPIGIEYIKQINWKDFKE